MSANPRHDSFLANWVAYSLDPDTGVPIAGTENRIRWFCVIDNKVLWADSAEECFSLHGEPKGMVNAYGMAKEELKTHHPSKLFIPKSFRFIPTGVMDNPYLLPPRNTSYLANLLSQNHVNQLVFLHGSWTARESGSSYFMRDFCEVVDFPPVNPTSRIRAWDLAASEKTTSHDPDSTVGIKMSRDSIGTYYIEDMVRFQKRTEGVLREIVDTAINDGIDETQVCIPVDVGAAGKTSYQYYSGVLAEQGVYVKKDQISGHTSKLTRFKPFCSLAESGRVKVVRAEWNEVFFQELENFTGERSRQDMHDDIVDATSSAFTALARQVLLPTFSVPILEAPVQIPTVS